MSWLEHADGRQPYAFLRQTHGTGSPLKMADEGLACSCRSCCAASPPMLRQQVSLLFAAALAVACTHRPRPRLPIRTHQTKRLQGFQRCQSRAVCSRPWAAAQAALPMKAAFPTEQAPALLHTSSSSPHLRHPSTHQPASFESILTKEL